MAIMAILHQSWAAQIQTRLYWVPVLLAVGIALYFAWPHEPGLVRPILASVFLALFAGWLRETGQNSISYLIILGLFCVVTGFAAAKVRAVLVVAPMIETSLGPVGMEGRIRTLEQLEGGTGVRVLLDDLVIEGVPVHQTPKSLRLSIRKGDAGLMTGLRIRVFAKVEPPSPPTTPGGFNFRRHAFFAQIGGYGYVLGAPKWIKDPEPRVRGDWFENARNHITRLVDQTLVPRQAGLVAALLTGERAAIAKEDWQALRDSGLAHLLAISGSNVDMVAVIVFFVIRLIFAAIPCLALTQPIKKYAAIVAFFAALFYVLLIYPSTPTWRAMLTVGVVLLAILLDRSPISLRLVCTTAIVILILRPEQLLSPSFQLSYAAVLALVAVFEWISPWLKETHRDAGWMGRAFLYLASVCVTTVIATIATAPISLYHFQTLALYGVVANLLAVPVMTFLIMPLGILCYILIPFGIAVPVLHVLGALCHWILDIAHMTSALPGARLTPMAIPLSAFLWIVATGLILFLGARWFKLLALVPVLFTMIILIKDEHPRYVVLQAGKVVMARLDTGEIVTTTRRYARRQQADWIRYWGGDAEQGARVVKRDTIPLDHFILSDDLKSETPVVIYQGPPVRVVSMEQGPHQRLWDRTVKKMPDDQ